jgi:hypothetical protein
MHACLSHVRKRKVRAVDSGQTLSDYLLAELARLAARPTSKEMLAKLHGRNRVTLKTPATVVIREERESAYREALDAPIVTCDTPLAKAPGLRARIDVIE